jgi:predicted RNA-binding Zn-ribbon protein involved in translation (DUF1610 family)
MVRSLIRCYKCNWEGSEEQLVETPGNLIFYDYVAINMGIPDIARTDFLCPRCGEMLRSHRMSNGMVFDQ